MALTIKENKGATKDLVTADRKLWLDAEGQAVEDGDPAARQLLCGKGQLIERATAEAAGVSFKKDAPAEDKASKAPAEDKKAKPAPKKATPKGKPTSKKRGK